MNRNIYGIIIGLVLALLIPSFVYLVYGSYGLSEGIWFIERICSITLEEPFYNCDVKWIYIYLPHETYIIDPVTGGYLYGFAFNDSYNWDEFSDEFGICNFFPQILAFKNGIACNDSWFAFGNSTNDTCWDNNCKSMFQHELDHMICECNWHENMTRAEGMENL